MGCTTSDEIRHCRAAAPDEVAVAPHIAPKTETTTTSTATSVITVSTEPTPAQPPQKQQQGEEQQQQEEQDTLNQEDLAYPDGGGNRIHHEPANLAPSKTPRDNAHGEENDDVFRLLPQFSTTTTRAAHRHFEYNNNSAFPNAQPADTIRPRRARHHDHINMAVAEGQRDDDESQLLRFEREMRQSQRLASTLNDMPHETTVNSPLGSNSHRGGGKQDGEGSDNHHPHHHRSASSFADLPPPSFSSTQAEPVDSPSVLGTPGATPGFAVDDFEQ